jgi:hypothetical protein
MRICVQADNGDEVSIKADFVAAEQGVVTLEIENALYSSPLEIESVTLTLGKARELANALLSVADSIEFVSTRYHPSMRELRSQIDASLDLFGWLKTHPDFVGVSPFEMAPPQRFSVEGQIEIRWGVLARLQIRDERQVK